MSISAFTATKHRREALKKTLTEAIAHGAEGEAKEKAKALAGTLSNQGSWRELKKSNPVLIDSLCLSIKDKTNPDEVLKAIQDNEKAIRDQQQATQAQKTQQAQQKASSGGGFLKNLGLGLGNILTGGALTPFMMGDMMKPFIDQMGGPDAFNPQNITKQHRDQMMQMVAMAKEMGGQGMWGGFNPMAMFGGMGMPGMSGNFNPIEMQKKAEISQLRSAIENVLDDLDNDQELRAEFERINSGDKTERKALRTLYRKLEAKLNPPEEEDDDSAAGLGASPASPPPAPSPAPPTPAAAGAGSSAGASPAPPPSSPPPAVPTPSSHRFRTPQGPQQMMQMMQFMQMMQMMGLGGRPYPPFMQGVGA